MPVKVGQIEITEPVRPLHGTDRYERIRLLVRHEGKPLGWVWIVNSGRRPDVSPERIREEIEDQLDTELVRATLGQRFDPRRGTDRPSTSPLCSVVICTRDRAPLLEACLSFVLDVDYPSFEVVVVDNAPTDDTTRTLTSRLPVRYVREDRPGLDWARNRGLSESRGEIVAFVDDDAQPDGRWLRAIAGAFADPDVMAVSGPVAALELETRSQMLFEFDLGGMTQSLDRRTIRAADSTATELLWSSSFVVGTNMAYRRCVFDLEPMFDPALDVGTASGSGGDLEMCHRLVARGHTLVYEPEALVWHVHRRTVHGLERQLYANQTGFGSYLLTCARRRTVRRLSILRFALVEWLWRWILRRLIRPRGVPRRLVWAELCGALRSPLAYLASRRQARRFAAMAEPDPAVNRLTLRDAVTESET